MRHRKSGRKLGRSPSHRDAMFRNMVTSLIEEERIQTTTPKAKELRRWIEPLITAAGKNRQSVIDGCADEAERTQLVAQRVAAIRHAGKTVRGRDTLAKLFGEIGERYADRPGGYTRIMRLGNRTGDNAEMAVIELVKDYEPEAAGVDAEPAVEDDLAEA